MAVLKPDFVIKFSCGGHFAPITARHNLSDTVKTRPIKAVGSRDGSNLGRSHQKHHRHA